ncbi:ABC transporter ATP-binding protein [uncultured Ruegeria sp.]|uniref:ABC transporter ATP-binding protein n=1 Tax=uncultured Ruegeria sp. TaxID=259304 RepID=UPI002632724A|nr:ABC transporter ATP-binding protein [uncultured Ruegeria sp.]
MTDVVYEAEGLRISATRKDGSELPIVKGVDFRVRRGQVVALIGESGSGKTTISLSALGYCKPGLTISGGQARLLGQDVTQMSTEALRPLRGEKVAYLAQSAAATFNPSLRINEQVTEAPVVHGTKTQAQADQRALELYRALDLPNPENIGSRYPHQVSGGQLQRLMAAMALCGDPDLLVLDEPTTALDVTTQIEVLKAFKKVIKDEGTAAIYVTHDLAVVAQIADYIVVLYNGKIQEKGPVDVIVNNPQHPYTKKLMAAVRPKPTAVEGDRTETVRDESPRVAAEHVTAGYGKQVGGLPLVKVLSDVSVDVGHGKTLGIIGESGSGKSTLARTIAGLLPASSGEVSLNGNLLPPDLRKRSKNDLRQIQFVYQMADTALNPRQRIGDILSRPLQFYMGLSGRERRAKVQDLLEMVKLPPEFATRLPHELSGGQKQRVNLARALAADPEVILCDEVTSALDSVVGADVIALLQDLRDNIGVSNVFISHDLSTVASFADEIAVLYAGRVVEKGPTDCVLQPPFHPYTKLLIDSIPEMDTSWLDQKKQAHSTSTKDLAKAWYNAESCPLCSRYPVVAPDPANKEDSIVHQISDKHFIECLRSRRVF